MNDTITPDSTFAPPAFTQDGRKGVSYDWQSLCDAETLALLDVYLNDQLELATTGA